MKVENYKTGKIKDVGMIIAVDYDGTLDFAGFPNVGKVNTYAVDVLRRLQSQGYKIILWTCRGGRHLEDAINELKKYDLIFDAVNENIEEVKQAGLTSPKVVADLYIDDRAIGYGDINKVFEKL